MALGLGREITPTEMARRRADSGRSQLEVVRLLQGCALDISS